MDMMIPMVRNIMGLGFIPKPMVTAADGVLIIKTDKECCLGTSTLSAETIS